jgi:AcrR family transcriptional regulator
MALTKKQKFHQAALTLIHKKGFKAMTMRDLASELSCNIKNLYNYTQSKPALLEELLFEISNDFHAGIDSILESDLNAVGQIEELIRLHVELSSNKPLYVGLLVNEWRNLSEEQLKKFGNKRLVYEQKVAAIIKKGIKEQHFRNMNVDVAMHYILNSLRWQYNFYAENKKANTLNLVKELKALILPGLK